MTPVSFAGASVLVTGGTGSFGRAFVRRLLSLREQVEVTALGDATPRYLPGPGPAVSRVIVFSRDELKQHDMRLLPEFQDERVRWFIGDVRNRERLELAMQGVDVVVHAAAMKQVEACEYNPDEAIATNVDGSRNVIKAALKAGVPRVLALSTDKAVDPINVYGKSKALAEDCFVDANNYSGADGPSFACVRYGNVISSRGSVLPLWVAARDRGEPLRVTDPGMTRFVLTLDGAVDFVLTSLGSMRGGEVFVPRLPAVDLMTIAAAVCWPGAPRTSVVGVRHGEKTHELLISANEAHRTRDDGDRFVVYRWLGEGGMSGEFSSATAERLDVAGFRSLAGLGVTEVAA